MSAAYIGITAVSIFVVFGICYIFITDHNNHNKNKKDDVVCMSKAAYETMIRQPRVVYQERVVPVVLPTKTTDVVEERDRKVVNDDLYPALNRTSANLFRDFHVYQDVFNIPTQPTRDTYRLIGYLKNDQDSNGTWKLFGRDKDRNRGEFYIVPTNNYNDIKIQLTDNIVSSREKLRSLDTIPDSVTFNSPLLEKSPYTFIELPKGDLSDLRYL